MIFCFFFCHFHVAYASTFFMSHFCTNTLGTQCLKCSQKIIRYVQSYNLFSLLFELFLPLKNPFRTLIIRLLNKLCNKTKDLQSSARICQRPKKVFLGVKIDFARFVRNVVKWYFFDILAHCDASGLFAALFLVCICIQYGKSIMRWYASSASSVNAMQTTFVYTPKPTTSGLCINYI